MSKQKIDQTLERIRDARKKISAQHGHDIEKMIAYYRRQQLELEKETDSKTLNRKTDVRKNYLEALWNLCGNLWKEVVDEENLFLAAVKAMRGLEDEDVAEYGEADLKEKWQ